MTDRTEAILLFLLLIGFLGVFLYRQFDRGMPRGLVLTGRPRAVLKVRGSIQTLLQERLGRNKHAMLILDAVGVRAEEVSDSKVIRCIF